MKIVTKEMVEERIRNRFPNEPFEIIEYTKISKPIIIKCLDCQRITKYSTCNNFLGAKKSQWCICHQDNHQAQHFRNQEKIKSLIDNDVNKDFLKFYLDKQTKTYRVKFLCKKCNQIVDKSWQNFLEYPNCQYCQSKEKINTKVIQPLLPSEYTLIEPYKGSREKVLIKHSCGFIWKARCSNIINFSQRCPKCYNRRSKGEQKIQEWSEKNGFFYQPEISFSWQTNPRCRYDIYIPELNLVIEYMGEQHYSKIPFFEKKEPLETRQQRDILKKEDALKNNLNYLAISYIDFQKIDDILNNWLNDYLEREQV